MERKSWRFEIVAVLAVAAIIGWLLIAKPLIGVANNGDFERIMGTVGLADLHPEEPYADKYFAYFHRLYANSQLGLGGYISTQLIPVFAAKLVNIVLFSSKLFDVRFLAGLYALVFLSGLYMILRWARTGSRLADGLLAALFVVVFADVGYMAYFNSLFGEPVTFAFLFLMLGFGFAIGKSKRPTIGMLAGFYISAFMMFGSKIQYAPIGIVLALLGFRLWKLRDDRSWRRAVIWMSGFLAIAAVAFYVTAPKELSSINNYQTVFYGVLKDSPTPERDLEKLGISPELAVLANTNYFTADTPIKQNDPMLKEAFYDKISYGKIIGFYLTHPSRFVSKLEKAAENGRMLRPYYLGTYEKSVGKQAGAVAEMYSGWSKFKKDVWPHSLLSVIVLYIVYFAGVIGYYIRSWEHSRRFVSELLAAVGVIGAIAFVVPIIGDGEADLGKHLFLYSLCYDVMLVTVVAGLTALAVRAIAGRR